MTFMPLTLGSCDMGGLNPFKKPKIDKSALARQEEQIRKQEAELAKQEEDQRRKEEATLAARRGRSSRSSLVGGLETGVTPVGEKRATLG